MTVHPLLIRRAQIIQSRCVFAEFDIVAHYRLCRFTYNRFNYRLFNRLDDRSSLYCQSLTRGLSRVQGCACCACEGVEDAAAGAGAVACADAAG